MGTVFGWRIDHGRVSHVWIAFDHLIAKSDAPMCIDGDDIVDVTAGAPTRPTSHIIGGEI